MQPTMCYQCGINPGTRQRIITQQHKHGGVIREVSYSSSSTNVLICEMCELRNSLPKITPLFVVVNIILFCATMGIGIIVTILLLFLKSKKKKEIYIKKQHLESTGLKPTF